MVAGADGRRGVCEVGADCAKMTNREPSLLRTKELIATATFGLEAVVRREIENTGLKVIKTEDGKVTFSGAEGAGSPETGRAIARANLRLAAADRVLLKMAEFKAEEPDDLFFGVKGIAWEELIPRDGRVIVTCSTVKSKLRSEPNNQKTVKKAIVERLREKYGLGSDAMLPETGALFTVKVTLLKDVAAITVDTSGEGLHKRGYRVRPVAAPLKETLAAALIELSFWKPGRVLLDPCCGSGTIAIEAALKAKGVAPGAERHFAAEDWDLIPEEVWEEERKAASGGAEEVPSKPLIYAFDIDPEAVDAAKENAEAAGVADLIRFGTGDISHTLKEASGLSDNGIVITNPPYGERIGDQKALDHVLGALKLFMKRNACWSVFLISPDRKTEEKAAGRRADRRRKLYNGNIEVCYYQFHGAHRKEKL